MGDSERNAKFRANFERLKRNREQVPMEKLRTAYARKYNALVAEITADADWFADKYLEALTTTWPRHPKDTAGNVWLDGKVAAIVQQETQPGALRDQWRAALIDSLDMADFRRLVWERYNRCEQEAFDPYWQRHNRWVGPPENRWIYNDIIRKYWWPPDETWPHGCWFDSTTRQVYSTDWPPHIKEEQA